MVPWEVSGRGLGVRFDDPRSDAEARPSGRGESLRRGAFSLRPPMAEDLGRRVHLQRCLDDPRHIGGVARFGLSLLEVIVVNDGSTDETPQIASNYPYRVINEENQGLSRARNTGIAAATGEIVAFIDDDAYPDPHWLRFIALSFIEGKFAAVGGPNLAPMRDGWRADAIANAPGGPNAVLISHRTAEHIPGCNMAFRKEALESIGGFDPRFRTGGDDGDLC